MEPKQNQPKSARLRRAAAPGHGRRSAQFAQLGVILAGNPKTRDAMLNFARRLDGKQQTAIAGAIELHARIIEEARKIARGEPSPFEQLLRTNTNPPLPRTGEAGRPVWGARG